MTPFQLVHVQDELLKSERKVDWLDLYVLGRLSGKWYCAVLPVIESETKTEKR